MFEPLHEMISVSDVIRRHGVLGVFRMRQHYIDMRRYARWN